MQQRQREWIRPPPHLNGWGWQTEGRLDDLEEAISKLPADREKLDRLGQSLSALSRRSLGDWAVQNRRKLVLYAVVILLLSGNLTVAELKDKITLKLPFGEGAIGGALKP